LKLLSATVALDPCKENDTIYYRYILASITKMWSAAPSLEHSSSKISPFIFASLAVERILSESFIIQLQPISYLDLCTSKRK
jgi:hypothetical protein